MFRAVLNLVVFIPPVGHFESEYCMALYVLVIAFPEPLEHHTHRSSGRVLERESPVSHDGFGCLDSLAVDVYQAKARFYVIGQEVSEWQVAESCRIIQPLPRAVSPIFHVVHNLYFDVLVLALFTRLACRVCD